MRTKSVWKAAKYLFVGLLATGLAAVAPARAETVTVFAAASTTNAVQAAMDRFKSTHPDISVRTSFASSSTLAKQIAHGAPADVYLSANIGWMDYLEERGAIDMASRIDLLANRLVLVTPRGADRPADLQALPDFLADSRLALGDPSHVPAGIYAKTALTSLGLWQQVSAQTAFSSDVRAALALVARGEAAAGMVYATDAQISEDVARVATFPADSHPPIHYPLARVADRNSPGVQAVYDFFQGPEAAAVFRKHGFSVLSAEAGS